MLPAIHKIKKNPYKQNNRKIKIERRQNEPDFNIREMQTEIRQTDSDVYAYIKIKSKEDRMNLISTYVRCKLK